MQQFYPSTSTQKHFTYIFHSNQWNTITIFPNVGFPRCNIQEMLSVTPSQLLLLLLTSKIVCYYCSPINLLGEEY